ncbi:unnamed protein product [Moneuplotes crassus]|uniref:Uncharacterized protein n=1 Tax=Euplotes crassus TaxID=5936 RepID=A0AAD1XC79_EUPCR|nr:unnamed protein product [Moneuplotes crassus]
MTLMEDNKIEKIGRNSMSFRLFLKELEIEETNNDLNIERYDPSLTIYFNWQIYLQFVKIPNFLGSLKANNLSAFYVKVKNKKISRFFKCSFPQKITALYLSSHQYPPMNISPIFNSLMRASSKVSQRIGFDRFKFSAHQLKRVIASFKHIKKICFYCCKISVPAVIDFSQILTNTMIKMLAFNRSGGSMYSDWERNPQEFRNLIKGLASSPDFKLSFRRICADNCGIEKNEIWKILNENGFYDINISA